MTRTGRTAGLARVFVLCCCVAAGAAVTPAPAAETPDELYARGQQALAAGRAEEAVSLFRQALAIDPDHWESLCRVGEIQAASRRFAEAEASLERAVSIRPDSGPCQSRLAQVLLVNGKMDEAEKALQRASALMPDDSAVLFNLARLYDNTDRPEQAVEVYRKFLAVDPQGRRSAAARLRLARLLVQVLKPEDAIDYYRTYLAGQPDIPEVRAELAAALMRASRYNEAMAEYDRVFAAGVADAPSLSNAGAIALLLHDLPRAVELLGRAVEADPKDIAARIALATALAQSNDNERAVTVLRTVTRDEPENMRAYFLLGQSLMKLGRTEEARQALERHREIHEAIMKERMSSDKPEGHP